MPAPGKLGSSIVFGKIAISSDTADVHTLEKVLKSIIRDIGYPDQEKPVENIQALLQAELEKERERQELGEVTEVVEAKQFKEKDRKPWMR